MDKPMKIINLVLRILAIVVLVFVLAGMGLTAYIVFAPDTMPKPFYLTDEAAATPTAEHGDATTPAAGKITPTGRVIEIQTLEIKPGEGIMVPVSTKIINLAEQGGKRYIRVSMTLEFAPGDAAAFLKMTGEAKTLFVEEFNTEINSKVPIIDDIIITLLSQKTFDDLYTALGKEELKKQIVEAINKQVPDVNVLAVYFTEFVVE